MRHLISAIAAAVIIPGIALSGLASPARAAKQIAHLEWLPMVSGSACAISPTCPAVSNGIRVSRGLRIDSSSHAEIRLDGRFQDLYGTIYMDDASDQYASGSVQFTDTSDPSVHINMLSVPTCHSCGVPFAISVRGVRDIFISISTNYRHMVVAVVASVATDAPAATKPASPAGTVTPLFPANGTPVPAGSKVLFTWKPYPGATIYALQIWLTHRTAAKPLPAGVPVVAAATASGRTSYTWSDRGYPSGTYQYAILPLDAAGTSIGSWSQPVQIAIVG